MSYKVLALKYRPQTFAAVVGQNATLLALQHALDKNQLHHAYLFTGTRGVGKTTLARILAKSFNCERGVSATPCGVCDMCTSIARGDNIDVIEIDAASRTKVEDTRDLLDNVPYAPVRARYKIYIIDEVHMLSNHSFNALLKTLEEPPEHVKFILATTDPQKLPITVLSRCLQFQLRNLTNAQIITHLEHVLNLEQIPFEPLALPLIAEGANGSMRDALSLLEQVVAFGNRNITVVACREILGSAVITQTLALLGHIIAGNAAAAIACVREMYAVNADFNNVLKMLQTFIHQVALVQVLPQALDDNAHKEQLIALAAIADAADLQIFYQTALLGVRDLPYAPDLVLGFEMLVLRMVAFKPVNVVVKDESVTTVVTPAVIAPPAIAAPKAQPISVPPPVKMAAPVIAPPVAPVAVKTPISDWANVLNALNLSGFAKLMAENCTVATWSAEAIALTLHESQKALLNPKNIEKVQAALQAHFGNKVQLTITAGTLNTESPFDATQRMKQADNVAAEQAIRADKHLQQLEETFSAKIADIHINDN